MIATLIGIISSRIQKSSSAILGSLVLATVYCTPAFLALIRLRVTREGFQEPHVEPVKAAPSTVDSNRNPFMNVLIDEIKYNPSRGEAVSITDPLRKIQLDDFFRTDFASDPTDVFGKTQSQRQFITMPSTSIPNDQASYQNWLYKINGKTCKEGGSCLPGTDGGALPWLNIDR